MEREHLAGWLRLVLTPEVGNGAARRLLAAFGLPQAVFDAPTSALGQLASAAQVKALHTEPEGLAEQVEAHWRWLGDSAERRIFTLADAAYPPALLQTADPPLVLHAMGRALASGWTVDAWPRAIAIVGSRNPTPQGAINARAFARSFAEAGWTVVSGLALGVDGAAHEGALEGGTQAVDTIAVVGTGLDRVYPRQHLELAHRITQRGLVVSEYLLDTPPLAPNFPRRNRVIAALSQGTLVVEAALQSGSLITARQAAEQGREVFAIPGSIHSAQSRGCHALLKQGAKLVETAQDVLEDLAPSAIQSIAAHADAEPVTADFAPEDALLQALGHDPVSLDALVARTGLPTGALQARLLTLELDGQVARLPGGLFQRMGSA